MLVTFRTKAFANITMFGDVAIQLLKLMGHSGTVPSAIEPEDIPETLKRLKTAIENEPAPAHEGGEDADNSGEIAVSLKNRALPLVQLLEAAEKDQVPVLWDT